MRIISWVGLHWSGVVETATAVIFIGCMEEKKKPRFFPGKYHMIVDGFGHSRGGKVIGRERVNGVPCVKSENQEVIDKVQPTVSTKGTKVSKAQARQEKAYKYNIGQSRQQLPLCLEETSMPTNRNAPKRSLWVLRLFTCSLLLMPMDPNLFSYLKQELDVFLVGILRRRVKLDESES